ncbi:MAG: DUF4830 domain-containing protein [Bacteroides sp.]|nr:DUF4830 domain-containing protein [Eubacterium sp.]MCM1419048.1 DUF4830 domain-containing protein [Roseburia sp.]MCM1463609.1 DUF4830 domain-containing protein [Bacteroides sp.]
MKRKHFIPALVASSAAAAGLIAVCSALDEGVRAENADDAAAYLSECGIRAVYSSEKNVTIPSDFGAVYERYNALQKAQGFDLAKHKGHSAVSYTFTVADTEYTEAHLLVCDGRIVAADLADTRLGGTMTGLNGETVEEKDDENLKEN